MQRGDWRAAHSGEPAGDPAGVRPAVQEVRKPVSLILRSPVIVTLTRLYALQLSRYRQTTKEH